MTWHDIVGTPTLSSSWCLSSSSSITRSRLRNSALSFSYSSFLTSQKVVSLSCVWHIKHHGFKISHSMHPSLVEPFMKSPELDFLLSTISRTKQQHWLPVPPWHCSTTHIYSFTILGWKGASGVSSLDSQDRQVRESNAHYCAHWFEKILRLTKHKWNAERWMGRSDHSLQMNRSRLRNNPWKLKTPGNLPTIWEESTEYPWN